MAREHVTELVGYSDGLSVLALTRGLVRTVGAQFSRRTYLGVRRLRLSTWQAYNFTVSSTHVGARCGQLSVGVPY